MLRLFSGTNCITVGSLLPFVRFLIAPKGAADISTASYDFGPVSVFWLAATLTAFILPVIFWKKMKPENNLIGNEPDNNNL